MMNSGRELATQNWITGGLLPVEWPRIGSAPASTLASWRDKTPGKAAEEKSELKE
jgi:hypothetical protein